MDGHHCRCEVFGNEFGSIAHYSLVSLFVIVI
jgi:hypothetical protein